MHLEAGSTASEGVILSSNVFWFTVLTEKEKRTVYTDAMGALPVLSLDRH